MPKRSKRGSSSTKNNSGDEKVSASGPPPRQLPAPRPPTKNLPLLIACAALAAAWMIVLALLAWAS